jgi:hypothetical protein
MSLCVEARDVESLVNFVEIELAGVECLVEAAGLQDKPEEPKACPTVGVYSSAMAEGILKILDKVGKVDPNTDVL